MPTVTVRIFGQGKVRVSQKLPSETSYTELGVASQPESDWSFGFWDMGLFSASPEYGWAVEKMCSAENKVCKETSLLSATIDKQYDLLNVYFKPLPPPPQAQNPIEWLWNVLFGWMR